MFKTIIVGNVDACRTEAEISDETGNTLAIVYEDSSGWHTKIIDEQFASSSPNFKTHVENAKETLMHYINRRGADVPNNLKSVGALALWLMVKNDGTAMGQKL